MSDELKESVGENPVIDPDVQIYFPSELDKLYLNKAIFGCIMNPPNVEPDANRKKNAADSVSYRKQGNKLYCIRGSHGWQVHKQILELYTKSIVSAPNGSEELALAYANRSALLYHLQKYKDCIKDCDQAANVTVSDYLEAKVLCRKAECLAALNDKMTKYVCEEASRLLEQLTLDEDMKSKFMQRLNQVKKICLRAKAEENRFDIAECQESLPILTRSKEAPCASDAVAIKYSKKWGRHIVATRKIEPGETIAVEKNYYTFIHPQGLYLYCSNCSRFTWSSIPCKHCIYGVYCSETCRKDAWEKFHQFECDIFPLLWHFEKSFTIMPHVFRFLLIAIHEVGGIQAIKEEYLNILEHKDFRTKGFSDGVFHSNKCKSLLSFIEINNNNQYNDDMDLLADNVVTAIYLLAKCTTFFGKKWDWLLFQKNSKDDIHLIGAFLIKIYTSFSRYSLTYDAYYKNSEFTPIGLIFNPFCGLFNHSCDENVKFFCSKNQETIIYAKYPINKGEQLFRNYYCNFLGTPKEERQAILLKVHQFKCECQPCNENWSNICLPFAKDITNDWRSVYSLEHLFDSNGLTLNDIKHNTMKYIQETLKIIVQVLKNLANNLTIHCEEYRLYECFIFILYNGALGFENMIPDEC